MPLMKESLILIAIGLTDLAYTLFVTRNAGAVEGNPIMSYYLQLGVGAFVVVKLGLLFLPIFIAEWSKHHKPQFVKVMMRAAIAAYLGSYILMFVIVNVMPFVNERASASPPPIEKVAEVRTK